MSNEAWALQVMMKHRIEVDFTIGSMSLEYFNNDGDCLVEYEDFVADDLNSFYTALQTILIKMQQR